MRFSGDKRESLVQAVAGIMLFTSKVLCCAVEEPASSSEENDIISIKKLPSYTKKELLLDPTKYDIGFGSHPNPLAKGFKHIGKHPTCDTCGTSAKDGCILKTFSEQIRQAISSKKHEVAIRCLREYMDKIKTHSCIAPDMMERDIEIRLPDFINFMRVALNNTYGRENLSLVLHNYNAVAPFSLGKIVVSSSDIIPADSSKENSNAKWKTTLDNLTLRGLSMVFERYRVSGRVWDLTQNWPYKKMPEWSHDDALSCVILNAIDVDMINRAGDKSRLSRCILSRARTLDIADFYRHFEEGIIPRRYYGRMHTANPRTSPFIKLFEEELDKVRLGGGVSSQNNKVLESCITNLHVSGLLDNVMENDYKISLPNLIAYLEAVGEYHKLCRRFYEIWREREYIFPFKAENITFSSFDIVERHLQGGNFSEQSKPCDKKLTECTLSELVSISEKYGTSLYNSPYYESSSLLSKLLLSVMKVENISGSDKDRKFTEYMKREMKWILPGQSIRRVYENNSISFEDFYYGVDDKNTLLQFVHDKLQDLLLTKGTADNFPYWNEIKMVIDADYIVDESKLELEISQLVPLIEHALRNKDMLNCLQQNLQEHHSIFCYKLKNLKLKKDGNEHTKNLTSCDIYEVIDAFEKHASQTNIEVNEILSLILLSCVNTTAPLDRTATSRIPTRLFEHLKYIGADRVKELLGAGIIPLRYFSKLFEFEGLGTFVYGQLNKEVREVVEKHQEGGEVDVEMAYLWYKKIGEYDLKLDVFRSEHQISIRDLATFIEVAVRNDNMNEALNNALKKHGYLVPYHLNNILSPGIDKEGNYTEEYTRSFRECGLKECIRLLARYRIAGNERANKILKRVIPYNAAWDDKKAM